MSVATTLALGIILVQIIGTFGNNSNIFLYLSISPAFFPPKRSLIPISKKITLADGTDLYLDNDVISSLVFCPPTPKFTEFISTALLFSWLVMLSPIKNTVFFGIRCSSFNKPTSIP